jgi:hypothetical protein
VTTGTTTTASDSTAKAAAAAATATDFFAQTAKQSTEQWIRALRQSANFSLEATSAWLDTVAKFVPSMPALPFAPSEETVKAWTNAGFDTAQNLLDLEREVTTEVISKFAGLSA